MPYRDGREAWDGTVPCSYIPDESPHICDPDGVGECAVKLPTVMRVCPGCGGRGRYVNPSIDEHGLTQADFDEAGPGFFEDYMSGVYDVQCATCGGQNVVPEFDRDIAKPWQVAAHDAWKAEEDAAWAEDESERRYFRMAEDAAARRGW